MQCHGQFQSVEQQQAVAAAAHQFSEDRQWKWQLEEQQECLLQQQLEEQAME
jgi:hypothetical protein